MKLLGSIMLLIAMGSVAWAQVAPAPEVNPSSAGTALALISGAVLVMRGRRKK